MIKHYSLYAILIFAITFLVSCEKKENDPQPNTPEREEEKNPWTAKTAFPGTGRKEAASFVIGDKIYFGTGFGLENNAQQYLKDFWEYNTTTNTWSRKADFPGGAIGQTIYFSVNGKGYIGLGYRTDCPSPNMVCNPVYFNDLWQYTPQADVWDKVNSFDIGEFGFTASGTAWVINNKAYIQNLNKFWEFDPVTNSLISKADLPISLANTAGFSIGDKGYIGTGFNGSARKDFYEYNPSTDQWTKKADFAGGGRYGAVSFVINGKGYIGSGIEGTMANQAIYSDVWQYSPSSNTWEKVEEYPGEGKLDAVGNVVNEKAYIGTGDKRSTSKITFETDFWEYIHK